MKSKHDYQIDIDAVAAISAVPAILEMVCHTTGMGFAAVARVTEERWITCSVLDKIAFGLQPGDELKIGTTICNEIRQSGKAVVIDHVAGDPFFSTHHTPALYGFQSYISVPIILEDGSFFGTLCAIDPRPANLIQQQAEKMFRLFADLIAFHLNSSRQLLHTHSRLMEEQGTGALRDKFIAILGHDLRNPLGAVLTGAQLLLRSSDAPNTQEVARIILDASRRMQGLVENILDFARGRLDHGITLFKENNPDLESILNQVISEIRITAPERAIETDFQLEYPLYCDGKRIAQLFSNLLGNAIKYGDQGTIVKVGASCTKMEFILSVCNSGPEIPRDRQEHLFKPFVKGDAVSVQEGLGLGLYIASEISQAHEGTLRVTSSGGETCFTFSMPNNGN